MEESTPVKKTARTRKTSPTQATMVQDVQSTNITSAPIKSGSAANTGVTQDFDELVAKLVKSKIEFDNLQKEIAQIKQDWSKEQKQHELELVQQRMQEELESKREQETYQYNTTLSRKRAEDEFADRKLSFEKDLAQKKEELENQKRELEGLRKLSTGFDEQKEKAVKEALDTLEKTLTEKVDQEKKLREQEIKAEKDILNLKIGNLETDNTRLNREIEILKRSLEEATRQVKEIAVKVIESGSTQAKPQISSQE